MKKNIFRAAILIFLVFFFILSLSSCFQETPSEEYNGEANLKIIVDWEMLNDKKTANLSLNNQSSSLSNNNHFTEKDLEITHTGARVEYVEQDAYFAQSVKKEVADEKGIITFDLPATDNANIYALAVHIDDESSRYGNIAYLQGKIEGIDIPPDVVVEITPEDLDWVIAEWKPDIVEYGATRSEDINEDKTEEIELKDFEEGFTVPEEYDGFAVHFFVRDIFQIHDEITDIPYADKFIRVYGSLSYWGNPDGWGHFRTRYERENLDGDKIKTDSFQPYADASAFGFSGIGSFYIQPLMLKDFEINWE